jgi:hypothetical protein
VKILSSVAQNDVSVSGDRLSDFAQLREIGLAHDPRDNVRATKTALLQRLWGLEEGSSLKRL